MGTWNTISKTSRTRLSQALFVLETLCDEENTAVLENLRERAKMTLADLYLCTGEAPAKLEMRLQTLCSTGCVVMDTAPTGSTYRVDPDRILQINGISRRINQIREEALHEQSVSQL